ncbi:MAG: hypothetical protein JW723_09850 [Bacteroidales bacterium]|nr:hypothetical protein [Bacteroidales bacterium]
MSSKLVGQNKSEPEGTEIFAPTKHAHKPAHETASLSSNQFLEDLRKIVLLPNLAI